VIDIRWRLTPDSSNIRAIGWPVSGEPLMLVMVKSGKIYGYPGVTRQRAVALAYREKLWSKSIGQYFNQMIKSNFDYMEVDDAPSPQTYEELPGKDAYVRVVS